MIESLNIEDWVEAGAILRAHGVRGEVRIRWTGDKDLLSCGMKLLIEDDGGASAPRTVRGVRGIASGTALVTFDGIPDRSAAEAVRGKRLWLRRAALPVPAPGEFYVFELRGAVVHDQYEVRVGSVTRVADNGGQALLVLQSDNGERLLPLVPQVVRHFDRARRILHVQVPSGLWGDPS